MKNLILLLTLILIVNCAQSQTPIPYGLSLDSIEIYDGYYHKGPLYQTFHCYKPLTYDSLTSPILFAMHGQGGNGTSAIGDLDSIAERRKALIVAPNFPFSGFSTVIREQSADFVLIDTITGCILIRPATSIVNRIYNYVLSAENRQNVHTYMIGFSAGGQFVSRYMLWRQLYPDSIPIKMAVSSNAYYYTFPTDTFLSVQMLWPCGILPPVIPIPPYCINSTNLHSFCNGDILQYYNENYGILIGSGDVQQLNDPPCGMAEGNNRYERAVNFYNFCDSNAVTRGTTLQWQYVEVPGVGHDQHAMYNNKANPNDSSTIAETLLFDTPYHTVPSIATVASFYADTTLININDTVHFINTSYLATSYLWDFGDGNTSASTNPWHVYTSVDTFIVQLKAYDSSGCWNWIEKRNYIMVQLPNGLIDIGSNDFKLKVYPNPVSDFLSVEVNSKTEKTLTLVLYNLLGVEEKRFSFHQSTQLNVKDIATGIYIYKIMEGSRMIGVGKIVKE